MEYKDYYKTLGVSRSATPEQIKTAYRRLARKYHPDVSKEPNAEQQFKQVAEAYEVLKDTEKRAAYDRLGSDWRAGQDFRPPPGWGGAGGGRTRRRAENGFSEFFESLFGGGRRGRGRTGADPFADLFSGGAGGGRSNMAGEDERLPLKISVREAFEGDERTISVNTPQRAPDGSIVRRSRQLRVKIPAGIQSGQQIRLAGQGGPGLGGGPPGDLFLDVEVQPDAIYRTEGRDIFVDVPIAPWEAALGAKLQAPTLGGHVDVTIPAGSQSGRKLRLKERGLPGNPPGDQYLVLRIVNPPADSPAARQLFETMRAKLDFDPRAGYSKH